LNYKKLLESEDNKWAKSNESYYSYLKKLGEVYSARVDSSKMTVSEITERMITDSNCYIGDVKLARLLCMYELYNKVLHLAGDIAEVGIWRGDSFLLWSKFVRIFEPYSATQVYGFDWFKGMQAGKNDDVNQIGNYCGEYQHLKEIIDWQDLGSIAIIQNMDVITGMQSFVENRPYLRLKLLYIDCGIEAVLEATYKYLYPRLVTGGVLLMDHFNFKSSPTESDIIEKYIGHQTVYQMPYARNPLGYIIKNS